MSNIEKKTATREQQHDVEALKHAGEIQREKLRESLDTKETIDDSQREQDATAAKLEALKNASVAETQEESRHRENSPAERRGPISKKQLNSQFDRTMQHVREELPAPSRAFSKFIHFKPIEQVSDFLGGTVARPNALLTGALCAFILTLGVYLFAKNMGYHLSGFETIGAFGLGWLLGILYDYLRVMITGKKDS